MSSFGGVPLDMAELDAICAQAIYFMWGNFLAPHGGLFLSCPGMSTPVGANFLSG
jgi:hypothetical protein